MGHQCISKRSEPREFAPAILIVVLVALAALQAWWDAEPARPLAAI